MWDYDMTKWVDCITRERIRQFFQNRQQLSLASLKRFISQRKQARLSYLINGISALVFRGTKVGETDYVIMFKFLKISNVISAAWLPVALVFARILVAKK